ncbi:suppressor APC domain-containing protein 2-like isoform X4 [Dinothrombium tinctorium]|uniref:Suppressor APC domain-containing protein 2-like isoform X4 n=1 Tax=Dinothrombium tinctorium TaxID=1965070 RepID=A0A443RGR6_9ACAR|nr:suppressor APC domain-containing protein 2-like isoform X4 [Dinothrombium tinctorium]RWS14476.1 suppressor APC domain-containing protein 2-like isoform X4 [Dinothrombium tinctorium]
MKNWYKLDTRRSNGKSDEFKSLAVHGLPKRFIAALKELFDVLDDAKSGFVKLADIESRWVEESNPDVPKGFISCLRKVTPVNGLINFERFCAAVKICLLKNQAFAEDLNCANGVAVDLSQCLPQPPYHLTVSARPASVPLPDNACSTPSSSNSTFAPSKTYDGRAKSMPHLRKDMRQANENSVDVLRHYHSDGRLKGDETFSKSKIMNVLRDWRNSFLERHQEGYNAARLAPNFTREIERPPYFHREDIDLNNRFREPRSLMRKELRRHTVSHGIDISTIRRLQQFEQEKSVLLQGLEMIEKAKDWYLRKITSVQAKIRYLDQGCVKGNDFFFDAYQERMNFQTTRILAVNQQLAALIDSENGYPMHMNLAFKSSNPLNYATRGINPPPNNYNTFDRMKIQRLQEQNMLLTEEVGRKSEQITQLERDKSALIKELYQTRTNKSINQRMMDNENSAFM